VRVLVFQGRLRNGSIDSPLEPQPAPSCITPAHQECEYKPGGEQHAKQRQQQEPYEEKNNNKTLDISDLLIQNVLLGRLDVIGRD
jgi:hypothetical protein